MLGLRQKMLYLQLAGLRLGQPGTLAACERVPGHFAAPGRPFGPGQLGHFGSWKGLIF